MTLHGDFRVWMVSNFGNWTLFSRWTQLWRDCEAIPAFLTVFGIIRNQPLGGSKGLDQFEPEICCVSLGKLWVWWFWWLIGTENLLPKLVVFFPKKFLGQMDKPLTRWFESSRTSQVWKMKVETHSDWTWEINLLQNEDTNHGCKHIHSKIIWTFMKYVDVWWCMF